METKKHDLDQEKQQLADYIKEGNREGIKAGFWLLVLVLIGAFAIALIVTKADVIDSVSTALTNWLCK